MDLISLVFIPEHLRLISYIILSLAGAILLPKIATGLQKRRFWVKVLASNR